MPGTVWCRPSRGCNGPASHSWPGTRHHRPHRVRPPGCRPGHLGVELPDQSCPSRARWQRHGRPHRDDRRCEEPHPRRPRTQRQVTGVRRSRRQHRGGLGRAGAIRHERGGGRAGPGACPDSLLPCRQYADRARHFPAVDPSGPRPRHHGGKPRPATRHPPPPTPHPALRRLLGAPGSDRQGGVPTQEPQPACGWGSLRG